MAAHRRFRCWYCNRKYTVRAARAGERLTCGCSQVLRVPKRDGGNCRVRTLADWLAETVVYSGGGAFLGVCLGLLILVKMGRTLEEGWAVALVAALAVVGLLVGLLLGEWGIGWLGRQGRELHARD